ncbi:MAG TPA: tryptophan synthase subunit alpha [Gemmatimonadales bacterium]|nr:tryptophan synthase subunit alpha [Gemmatimonadales bacterium]
MISSSESRLAAVWPRLAAERRAALIPYLTAGHPDPATSLEAFRVAARHADILEVGVPFSDPVADGPTIQRSTFEALGHGVSLASTLDMIEDAAIDIPVVLFSYFNPVLQFGVERLIARATALGIAGLLLTDLPAGADPGTERLLLDSPLDLIRLVAPTSRGDRLAVTVADAQGFLYLVARLGVTGVSRDLDAGLASSIARVRAASALPIAVGFGIATPSQAREVGHLADGVVVGSAAVEALRTGGPEALDRLLGELRQSLEPA